MTETNLLMESAKHLGRSQAYRQAAALIGRQDMALAHELHKLADDELSLAERGLRDKSEARDGKTSG